MLYIMSIQPVHKAAEHLINSTPVLEKEKRKRKKSKKEKKKKKAVNVYFIKNSVCVCVGGGGAGTITSSRKNWAKYYVTVHPM